MTRENAKKLLPIITAFAGGKAIEFHSQGKWMDIEKEGYITDFSADPERYRIKAVTIFRVERAPGTLVPTLFTNLQSAQEYANRFCNGWFRIYQQI